MPTDPPPDDWCQPGDPDPVDPAGPELIPMAASALCSLGIRPLTITGVVRDVLTRHFAAPLGPEAEDLRRYVWRDDERTGILIESIHRWRGALVEKRPAVIVKRNSYQNMRWGIADRVRVNDRGFYEFSTGWVGSHTAFCIAGKGAAADILSTEVARLLHHWGQTLVEDLGLMRFGVTTVGDVSEIEEAREGFVVPVTVGWCYQESWQIKLESMTLRRLPVSVLLDYLPVDGDG